MTKQPKIKRFSRVMYRNRCQENMHGFRVTQTKTENGRRRLYLEHRGWVNESGYMPHEEWLARLKEND